MEISVTELHIYLPTQDLKYLLCLSFIPHLPTHKSIDFSRTKCPSYGNKINAKASP